MKDAKRRGDPRAMAIAEHRAGDVALDLDRCDEAEAHYVEALEEHRARGDLKLVAVAANDLGLHGNACQKDPIAWFQHSVETREQLGDTEALRVGLANLGGAAMLWRPPAEARPILERALALAESLGDVEGQRKVHVNLAATLMYLAIEPAPLDGGTGATPAVAAERKLLGFQHLERALALGRQLGLGPEAGAARAPRCAAPPAVSRALNDPPRAGEGRASCQRSCRGRRVVTRRSRTTSRTPPGARTGGSRRTSSR